jgi:hypothetical protein
MIFDVSVSVSVFAREQKRELDLVLRPEPAPSPWTLMWTLSMYFRVLEGQPGRSHPLSSEMIVVMAPRWVAWADLEGWRELGVGRRRKTQTV